MQGRIVAQGLHHGQVVLGLDDQGDFAQRNRRANAIAQGSAEGVLQYF